MLMEHRRAFEECWKEGAWEGLRESYALALYFGGEGEYFLRERGRLLGFYEGSGNVLFPILLASALGRELERVELDAEEEKKIFGPLEEHAAKGDMEALELCACHYFQYGKVREFTELLGKADVERVLAEREELSELLSTLREWRQLREVQELSVFKRLAEGDRRYLYPEEYP